jgi:hypothetical protein
MKGPHCPAPPRCRNHAAQSDRPGARVAGHEWQGNCYYEWAEATHMNCEKNGCRCMETAIEASGKNYCSESCAQLDATETGVDQTCLCGHDDCANS